MKNTIVILFLLLVIFLDFDISRTYPLANICAEINHFKTKNGYFPTQNAFAMMNKEPVGLLSKLEYKRVRDDFMVYFCPTILGPCEVCQSDGKVSIK